MLCVWFTGLPCAGKTTLAAELSKQLLARGENVVLFDGDAVRRELSSDLGFSREDRDANVLRVAAAARDAVESGRLVICSLISPYATSRREARLLIGASRFVEVYVNTPVEVCEARDTKGQYRLARIGKLPHFTGVDDPYEAPERPEITVAGTGSVEQAILQIVQELDRRR